MFSIHNGVLSPATQIPSPNFNARPANTAISAIIIHNISLPPNEFGKTDQHGQSYITALFTNTLNPNDHPYFAMIAGLEVSAHLVILRDGSVLQFVNFNDRAWHAGVSAYLGKPACNDYTIGIELEGCDTKAFSHIQYETLAQVIVAIYRAYPTTYRQLAGHSDIAPNRKTDPGKHFAWRLLRTKIQEILNKDPLSVI